VLAAAHPPGEALAKWLARFTDFIATKRGLAPALHSGNPAFAPLPGYFGQNLVPALRVLLEAAVAAGEIRAGVDAGDLLNAVANLSHGSPEQARPMVALLVDGLRYGARRAPA
jgi:hypothetical protein